ncbi:hypothetical protein HHI36_022956 [Cryptolaemus montrouzieri]|uniref:Uncharacterized protein n=1 Tax=Cryptolaemus montrouzieri TaxID=559131 RepID=A0ABD2PFH5_9CUCU
MKSFWVWNDTFEVHEEEKIPSFTSLTKQLICALENKAHKAPMTASETEESLAAAVALLLEQCELEIPVIDTTIGCEDVTLSLSGLNVSYNLDDLIVITFN